MIFKPKYFELYELLPEKFYKDNIHRGDNLWFIFDQRLLFTIDILREKFGKMFINTWYFGGKREKSGFRTEPVHAALSQHLFGRAADILFDKYTAEEVREDLIKNTKYFPYITGIETGVPWLHIDTRNYNGLLLFNK